MENVNSPDSKPYNEAIHDRSLDGAIGATALQAELGRVAGETVDIKAPFCMEIYPFSFEDDDSGQNVFNKISRILPHYKELGINTIWLAPVYPSPRMDMGYDISDYAAVDPSFGTMEELNDLVAEAHNHDQRVLMDLVLNHTSTEHEWFKKALAGDPKYQNYYYFTNSPQDGWHNFFDDQSAWECCPGQDGKYYLHSFHKAQADLRWFDEEGNINTDLVDEFRSIIDLWTKQHHIDGFRLDVPQAIDKDFSNPERSIQTLMSGDGEQSALVIAELFGNRPELLTTIEVFDPTDDDSIMSRYVGHGKPIQFAMNAFLAQQPEDVMLEEFHKSMNRTPELMVAIQSHDTSRQDLDNKILISLMNDNPSAVCLYMGQEIGIADPSAEDLNDEDFFRLDAQADMQFRAAVESKKQANGGSISESEINEIITEIRKNARANNRAPLNIEKYLHELEKQSKEPNSIYSQLKNAAFAWGRKEQEEA